MSDSSANTELTDLKSPTVSIGSPFSPGIRTLLRREIIATTGNGYRITVPLTAYYMRSQLRPV
jgi:hypothetical protein